MLVYTLQIQIYKKNIYVLFFLFLSKLEQIKIALVNRIKNCWEYWFWECIYKWLICSINLRMDPLRQM